MKPLHILEDRFKTPEIFLYRHLPEKYFLKKKNILI